MSSYSNSSSTPVMPSLQSSTSDHHASDADDENEILDSINIPRVRVRRRLRIHQTQNLPTSILKSSQTSVSQSIHLQALNHHHHPSDSHSFKTLPISSQPLLSPFTQDRIRVLSLNSLSPSASVFPSNLRPRSISQPHPTSSSPSFSHIPLHPPTQPADSHMTPAQALSPSSVEDVFLTPLALSPIGDLPSSDIRTTHKQLQAEQDDDSSDSDSSLDPISFLSNLHSAVSQAARQSQPQIASQLTTVRSPFLSNPLTLAQADLSRTLSDHVHPLPNSDSLSTHLHPHTIDRLVLRRLQARRSSSPGDHLSEFPHSLAHSLPDDDQPVLPSSPSFSDRPRASTSSNTHSCHPITPPQNTSHSHDLIKMESKALMNEFDLKLDLLQRAIDSNNFDSLDLPSLIKWDDEVEDDAPFQSSGSHLPLHTPSSTQIILTSSIVYTSEPVDHSPVIPPDRLSEHLDASHTQHRRGVSLSRSQIPPRPNSAADSRGLKAFPIQVHTIKRSLHTPLLSDTIDIDADQDDETGHDEESFEALRSDFIPNDQVSARSINTSSPVATPGQTSNTELALMTSSSSFLATQHTPRSQSTLSQQHPLLLETSESPFFVPKSDGTLSSSASQLPLSLSSDTRISHHRHLFSAAQSANDLPIHASEFLPYVHPLSMERNTSRSSKSIKSVSIHSQSSSSPVSMGRRFKNLGRKLGFNAPGDNQDSPHQPMLYQPLSRQATVHVECSGSRDSSSSPDSRIVGMIIPEDSSLQPHKTSFSTLNSKTSSISNSPNKSAGFSASSQGASSAQSKPLGPVRYPTRAAVNQPEHQPPVTNEPGPVFSRSEPSSIDPLRSTHQTPYSINSTSTSKNSDALRLDQILKQHQASEKLYMKTLTQNVAERYHKP